MASGRHRLTSAAVLSVCVAAVSVWVGPKVLAHDLERTEVTLTFAPDRSFVLDLANDPDWLLLRLEPFAVESGIAGRPRATSNQPLTVEARDAILARFAPVVIDRVVLWVDGREVRPESAEFIRPPTQTPADDLSPLGTYRLRGRVPTDVRSLRWFYGIVIDPYPLTIQRADGRELNETILGRAWSETLDLAGQFDRPSRREIIARYLALGFRYVTSTGLGQILFVLGLLLMTLRVRTVMVQLATFALAQTVGFALTMVGVMTPASRMLWPVVALSVAYVVVESLLTKELTRWRLAFIFTFGLFHGAQLTTALRELGAPAQFAAASGAFATVMIGSESGTMLAALLTIAALKRLRWSRVPSPSP